MAYGLVTYIILMHSYHPQYASWLQMFTQQRFLYIQSSQIRAYVFVRPGGHWSTHQVAFIILITALMFLNTKLTSAQGRSPCCNQLDLHPHRHQGVLENDTPHPLTSGWSLKKLTTRTIRTSVSRSTPSYVHIFVRGSDVPQASGAADLMRRLIA